VNFRAAHILRDIFRLLWDLRWKMSIAWCPGELNPALPQVSTGDLFRYNLKNQTELGQVARTYMDRGELVPDEVTVAMVKDRLSQSDCQDGVILDGFPRTSAQAEALDDLLVEIGAQINIVPHIHVEQDVLVERLLMRAKIEGRADDNEETIRTRMRVYEEQTRPLLEYYGRKGLVVEVNGQQSVEEVNKDLILVIQEAT
jgi:adenylate kinase